MGTAGAVFLVAAALLIPASVLLGIGLAGYYDQRERERME